VFEEFETKEYLVRKIVISDAAAIYANWAHEKDVALYTTWLTHESVEDTLYYVEDCIEAWNHRSYTWSIEKKIDSEIVGSFAAREKEHKIDIGYLLAKKFWGKGIMTEVVNVFIDEAFRQESIQRIGAVCDTDNPASKRVMEKAGMEYEGKLLSWMIHPNIGTKARDCHSLGITRERHNQRLQRTNGQSN